MKQSLRVLGVLAFLNVLWTPVNAMVDVAHGAGFSPVGIGLIRWSSMALVLALLVRLPFLKTRLNLTQPNWRDGGKSVVLGLLLTGPAHLFYYVSLQHIQTLEGNVFNTTAPLWTALFAGIFLRETIDRRRWTALGLGAVGAYVTAVGFALPNLQAQHALWNGLYLLGTVMESIAGVFIARLIRRSSGLTVFGVECLGLMVAMVLATLLMPTAFPLHVPAFGSAWLPLAYLVFLAGVVAFGGWTTVVEKAPISFMVVTLGLQAPLGALFGYWFLKETIPASAAVGAVLVCLALVVVVSERSQAVEPAPATS